MRDQSNPVTEPSGAKEPSLVIWAWRDHGAASHEQQRRRTRRLGWIRAAVGAAVAGVFALLGWKLLALIAGAFALVGALAATFAPEGLERVLSRFTAGVGAVLTFVLLVPLYLLFFTPFGWLFRSGSRDRMTPRLDPAAATYWSPRKPLPAGTEPLKRQF